MNSIESILEDRGKSYGSFRTSAKIHMALYDCIESHQNWELMPDEHKVALRMIVTKIARLLNGDCMHKDSWVDIAGYATLAADACYDHGAEMIGFQAKLESEKP